MITTIDSGLGWFPTKKAMNKERARLQEQAGLLYLKMAAVSRRNEILKDAIDIAKLARHLMLSGYFLTATDAFEQALTLHDKVKALVPDEPS